LRTLLSLLKTTAVGFAKLLVEWKKLDHSIIVAAISQWHRRLSAFVRAHGGHFEHIFMVFSWFSVLS